VLTPKTQIIFGGRGIVVKKQIPLFFTTLLQKLFIK